MTRQVRYNDLAATIAEELGVYLAEAVEAEFTVDNAWYTLNWVWVKGSFSGYHSSPYAGWVRLDPSAPETISLAQDFVHYLCEESGLTIPDLAGDDPLLRLIVEIVSNDEASDRFFEILSGQVVEEGFDLEAALSALQAEAETLLPGAEAWELAEVKRRKLDGLLERLAQEGQFRFDAGVKLREYKWQYVIHDHRHYLLFGQNAEHITPKAWFDAAWKFIQHFRCNFGMFVTEAMLYDNVTIIGADNVPVPVSREDQEFLEEYTGYIEKEDGTKERWRQVERLNVVNAQQLSDLLEDRIKRNVRFEGGEVTSLA